MPDFTPETARPLTGLILAGGQGRRKQGQDKGLVELLGRPLIEYALRTMKCVTGDILISANRNQSRYAAYGYPVLRDALPNYPGPLAGILAALEHTRHPLLVMPCDAPCAPPSLLRQLARMLTEGIQAVVAYDGRYLQPTFLALAPGVRDSLEDFLARDERKVQDWLEGLRPVRLDCSAHPEWFLNANAPADLAQLTDLTIAHVC
jgi:molybdopterin-guanine dinucleotide biosynthesis protein A